MNLQLASITHELWWDTLDTHNYISILHCAHYITVYIFTSLVFILGIKAPGRLVILWYKVVSFLSVVKDLNNSCTYMVLLYSNLLLGPGKVNYYFGGGYLVRKNDFTLSPPHPPFLPLIKQIFWVVFNLKKISETSF